MKLYRPLSSIVVACLCRNYKIKMPQKVTDLIKNNTRFTYSYEVSPDINIEEIDTLNLQPLFFSITWHAHQHQCKNLEIPPLQLANYLRSKGKDVLLNISCTDLKKDYVNELLQMLQKKDICNLFIISGDKLDSNKSDFKNSLELISYIRHHTGNYFCIGSAGFPGEDNKLSQLKEKVDAGVDFIITQAFFSYDIYDEFLQKTKDLNINVPIIPGIFPFDSPKELQTFVKLCKIHITEDLISMSSFKPGNEIVTDLIKTIIENLEEKHVHFFTLNNLKRTIKVVSQIDF